MLGDSHSRALYNESAKNSLEKRRNTEDNRANLKNAVRNADSITFEGNRSLGHTGEETKRSIEEMPSLAN